jgi:electron transport complex protein RnfE
MAGTDYGKIVRDGLWNNNQALVALLGLCPLLATTTSATNGLGMGIATTAVLLLSNVTISLIRRAVRPEVRIPVYVVVIASFVTVVELLMHAYFFDLHKVLGIGLGSTAALVTLGGLRELVGQGTLFAQAHLLLGDWARVLEFGVGEGFHGALVAILPPGAFIGLGFLIALKNVIDRRATRKTVVIAAPPAQPAKAG